MPPPRRWEADPELAARLRADLIAFVSGPVVELDLDTGKVSTLCGATARSAARSWQSKLADPARPAPTCRHRVDGPPPEMVCTQSSGDEIIHLELADLAAPRITSAILGRRAAITPSLADQVLAQVASATCP